MVDIQLNGKRHRFPGDDSTPLLLVVREHAGLTGTKFGCGLGQCGACTVHVDGVAMRSCITPISAVAGKAVTTIEGYAARPNNRLVAAWIESDAPQCGYCQPGMVMAAASLLAQNPKPTDDDIAASVTNLCRCGTYPRVIQSIKAASGQMGARHA